MCRSVLFYSDVMHKWAVPFPGADRAVVRMSLRERGGGGGGRGERERREREPASTHLFTLSYSLGVSQLETPL